MDRQPMVIVENDPALLLRLDDKTGEVDTRMQPATKVLGLCLWENGKMIDVPPHFYLLWSTASDGSLPARTLTCRRNGSSVTVQVYNLPKDVILYLQGVVQPETRTSIFRLVLFPERDSFAAPPQFIPPVAPDDCFSTPPDNDDLPLA